MPIPLSNIENFMKLLHSVQRVKRVSRRPNESEETNTAEHTFEVVMLSWYVASVSNRKLNFEKVLKYALAHDLIEAYAGDTFIYDTEGQKDKYEREMAAVETLRSNFTGFPELIEIITEYEKRNDEESRFVYAIDKLVDPLNLSMTTDNSLWKEYGITYQQVRDYKDKKIAADSTVQNFWEGFTHKLEEDLPGYFLTGKANGPTK